MHIFLGRVELLSWLIYKPFLESGMTLQRTKIYKCPKVLIVDIIFCTVLPAKSFTLNPFLKIISLLLLRLWPGNWKVCLSLARQAEVYIIFYTVAEGKKQLTKKNKNIE